MDTVIGGTTAMDTDIAAAVAAGVLTAVSMGTWRGTATVAAQELASTVVEVEVHVIPAVAMVTWQGRVPVDPAEAVALALALGLAILVGSQGTWQETACAVVAAAVAADIAVEVVVLEGLAAGAVVVEETVINVGSQDILQGNAKKPLVRD